MSYDAIILRRAESRLEAQRRRRRMELEQRQAEVKTRVPRIIDIDARLRQTLLNVARATFQGGDPTPRINELRDQNLALQDERKKLLLSAGFSPDAMDDIPACPKCSDKGWIGSEMCSCLKTLCAEEQIKDLSKLLNLGEQSFETFRLDYYSSEPWGGLTRSPRENMTRILDICRQYAYQFDQFRLSNLYLYGTPGLGKTFLSACIARVVSDRGYSVVYDTAGNVFSAFESKKFSKDEEDIRDARDETNRYLNCDLLILDDLGSELLSSLIQTSLYTLLNTRLVTNKRTVISSNLSPEEFRRRYTPQIASRLDGEFQPLPFFGDDIRLKQSI